MLTVIFKNKTIKGGGRDTKYLETHYNAEGGKRRKQCYELQTSSPNKYTMQNIQKDDKQETDLVPGKGEEIDERQFGFRKQKSSIDAILKITTKIFNGFKRKEKQQQSSLITRKRMTKSTERRHLNNWKTWKYREE